jgi:ribose transport system permease protein
MKKQHSIGTKLLGTLVIPAFFAAVLFSLCAANGKTMFATQINVNNFVLYAAIVMITTMALSINLNSGRFDFSLGAMAVLSSVLSAKLSYSLLGGGSGSAAVMLLLGIAIGAVLGLLSGLLYVTLRIPPIITSLGVTLIYEGVTFTVTEGKYVNAEVRNASMSAFSGTWIWSVLVILAVLALVWFIFDRTRFGYNYKALQNGQKVAVNTGIREVPNALVCYVICGALMGIVGFLSAVRNSTINGGSLNFGSIGIMFTAFLPMFIGGYIGRFSNDKLGYLIAALCMSLLNSTFAAFSNEVSASMQSIINALLLVVFLIYLSNEGLLKRLFQKRT